jgi:hypothetical protein
VIDNTAKATPKECSRSASTSNPNGPAWQGSGNQGNSWYPLLLLYGYSFGNQRPDDRAAPSRVRAMPWGGAHSLSASALWRLDSRLRDLHIPRVTWYDGMRFVEVALDYPCERHLRGLVRALLHTVLIEKTR